jgi:hypothetical protein
MKTMMMLASSVVLMVVGGLGCATTAARSRGARDVHASTVVSGGGDGRLVVAGPAVVLHLDVEGKNDVALYTVPARDGTQADCDRAGEGQATPIHRGHSNRVNLRVGTGQVVCVSAPATSGRSEVRWHARRLDPALANGSMVAFDDSHR